MEICSFSFGDYRYNLDIYLYFRFRTLGNLYALFTGNNFSAFLFHNKQINVIYFSITFVIFEIIGLYLAY